MASKSNFPNVPQFQSRTLEDFKARMIGGGARANLFEVKMNFPDFAQANSTPQLGNTSVTRDLDEMTRFMVKAAQLPASNIAEIPVPFRGRVLKVAGDRTFDPWTITVINDTDFQIRTAFEKWMNGINKHDDNSGIVTPADYQRDAYVMQLDLKFQYIKHIDSTAYSQPMSVKSKFLTITLT